MGRGICGKIGWDFDGPNLSAGPKVPCAAEAVQTRKEGTVNMNIQSILVLAGLVVFFVLAIAWISKNGGWQGGGCGGDCSHCASHCDDPEKAKKAK